MALQPRVLQGARHVHPRVQTEADYRREHRDALARGRALYPNLDWPEPWRADIMPPVFVAGGSWQIHCATPGCANCPAVEPAWHLALCWDCGAVYDALVMPEEAAQIQALLVARPMANRNWLPGETLAQLASENRAHGLEAICSCLPL